MGRRMVTAVLAAVLALGAAGGAVAQQRVVQPLERAHAHNDYEHDRPLYDSLSNGFTSVEADIFLAFGELYVAHEVHEMRRGRTLQSLYLDPLRRRVRAHGGDVYRNGPGFTLLIDIKTLGIPTYRKLHRVLAGYRDILTVFGPHGVRKHGAVTAIVSGERPRELMESQDVRYAGYDGRLEDLHDEAPASFMPLISDNWDETFAWQGNGPMPVDQRRRLRAIVRAAHADGRTVRFWETPDDPARRRQRAAVWRELVRSDVDHINTDHLAALRRFLLANDPQE